MEGTFQETIDFLVSLKSDFEKSSSSPTNEEKMQLTFDAAGRLGLKLEDLDQLSVIHVTGTKGKGSTCAFIESILRRQGYRTGFFRSVTVYGGANSSPHLVSFRERIRIGGRPLSCEDFHSYFWRCYNKLCTSKDDLQGLSYFQILTLMAFQVFLEEQVDVVILEVGIGGEYDATNIIRNPVVCGITSLELDHVRTLGYTLEDIAWHKTGIFKSGSQALTVPQPDDAMKVIQQRSTEKECPLSVVPSNIYSYGWGRTEKTLGISGDKQELNASLAVQLCLVWTTLHGKSIQDRQAACQDLFATTATKTSSLFEKLTFELPDLVIQGLQECYWPGRCQTLKKPRISYYMDGAHTPESVKSSARWFMEASAAEARTIPGKIVKVLMFNVTRYREVEPLLSPLLKCAFDHAVFCPHTLSAADEGHNTDPSPIPSKSQEIKRTWESLNQRSNSKLNSIVKKPSTDECDSEQENNSNVARNSGRVVLFGCVLEALHWVAQGRSEALPQILHEVEESPIIRSADHIQLLCTGSMPLVGSVLSFIQPDVYD